MMGAYAQSDFDTLYRDSYNTTPVSRHLNRWISYHTPKIKRTHRLFYKYVRPSQYVAMRQRFFFQVR